MLLGYHLLWSWTANVVGTDEQRDRAQENIIKNNYFIGGKLQSNGIVVRAYSRDRCCEPARQRSENHFQG